jgi:outer membrane protein insertion porin family
VERDGNVLVLRVEERPAIAQIEFSGNRDLDEKALRAAVADIGLKEGRVFNRSVLDRIEQELERQYFSRGKYGVLVQSTVSPLERNRVGSNIEITEGLTARIKQINIIGNQAFKEKELLKLFQLGPRPAGTPSIRRTTSTPSRSWPATWRPCAPSIWTGALSSSRSSRPRSPSAPTKRRSMSPWCIDEGDRFTVSDIKLAGEPSVPAEQSSPDPVAPRRVFSRKLTTESAERISKLLGDEGYAFANVNTVPEIDDGQQAGGGDLLRGPRQAGLCAAHQHEGQHPHPRRGAAPGDAPARECLVLRGPGAGVPGAAEPAGLLRGGLHRDPGGAGVGGPGGRGRQRSRRSPLAT